MSDINIKIKATLCEPDRGTFDEFPEGTKIRTFFIRNEEANTNVTVMVIFLPDGNRLFRYITDRLGERLMAYTTAEVCTIHAFNCWLSEHKDKIYPTGDHPAGLPLDQIEGYVDQPTTNNQGDNNAELGK